MRRLLTAISAGIAASVLLSGCGSCTGDGKRFNDTIDTAAVQPKMQSEAPQQEVFEATGEVTDGAMNSVAIKLDNGEVMEFAYPELPQEKRASFSLDEKTVLTVKYVKAMQDGEETDSVIEITKKE